jgi:hypothetical protein
MLVCYNAAKMLCRLQEAVVGSFGLLGLQCMQRGINFTIYAVLACIVLHLVRIYLSLLTSLTCFSVGKSLICDDLGRNNLARSGTKLGSSRVFYASYEDFGEMHEHLAYAGHAETG